MSLTSFIFGLPVIIRMMITIFFVVYSLGLIFGTMDIIDSRNRKYGAIRRRGETGLEAAVAVLKWPVLWPAYVPIMIGQNVSKLWEER